MRVSDDWFWRPDVRLALRTDDGAAVTLRYTGLVEQTPAFMKAATEDRETTWEQQYMRMVLQFALRLAHPVNLRRTRPHPGHRSRRIRGVPSDLTLSRLREPAGGASRGLSHMGQGGVSSGIALRTGTTDLAVIRAMADFTRNQGANARSWAKRRVALPRRPRGERGRLQRSPGRCAQGERRSGR